MIRFIEQVSDRLLALVAPQTAAAADHCYPAVEDGCCDYKVARWIQTCCRDLPDGGQACGTTTQCLADSVRCR